MRSAFALRLLALLMGALSSCTSGGDGSVSVVAITTTSANFAVVGNFYTSTLVAMGGTPPYTWAAVGGLPAWVSLDPSTGVLTGTPTASDVGNFTPTFRVIDSTGAIGQGSVFLAVHPRTDIGSVDNSTPPVPGNSSSNRPAISNDGRFIGFASLASNLVSGISGSQIYIHDRQTNLTSLVSRNSSGTPADPAATTSSPSISGNGRFIAFVSNATNLVAGASGFQIYLRDTQTGVTSLVSKDVSTGNPASAGSINGSPSISGNGRFIAYVSDATNLVSGITGQQVYLYDTQTTMAFPNGQTILISKNNNVTPLKGDGASSSPSISRDGCYVAFASLSTNLIAPPPGNQQIYVRGPLPGPGICPGTEKTSLVSKDNSGSPIPGNGFSSSPSMNSNGRFVAFTSAASNLLAGVSGQQIYLHDRASGANGTTSLISKDNSGPPVPGNGNSSSPSISDDACYVAFASLSTNFGTAGGNQQIYTRGPLPAPAICPGTEQTSLVSKDSSGTLAGNSGSDTPSTDADGGYIAFASQSTNLVSPSLGNQQIYVRATP